LEQTQAGGYYTLKLFTAILICLVCLPCFAWEILKFDISPDAKESVWRDALAEYFDGKTEVVIDGGRIDIELDDFVIEVDFIKKWTECLGQAIFYADATGKRGVGVLIAFDIEKKKIEMIDRLFGANDLSLIVLQPR
jgi:hypothetical protein